MICVLNYYYLNLIVVLSLITNSIDLIFCSLIIIIILILLVAE